jgi:uncharacterized YceG family protein
MRGDDYGGWQASPRGRRRPSGYDADADYDQPGGYEQPAGYGQPGGYDQPGGYEQPGAYEQPGPGYEPAGEYDRPGRGRRHAGEPTGDQAWDGAPGGYPAQDPYAAVQPPYNGRDWTGEQDPYSRTDPHGNAEYTEPPYDPRADYVSRSDPRASGPHGSGPHGRDGYGQNDFAQDSFAPGYDDHPSYPGQGGYQGQAAYDGRELYNGQAAPGEPEAFGGQDAYREPDGYGSGGYPGDDGYGRGPAGYGQAYDGYGAASRSGPMPAYTGGDEYGPAGGSQPGWEAQDQEYGRRGRRASAYQQEGDGHDGPVGGSRRSGRSMNADDDRHNSFFAGYASNDDDHYGGRPRRRRGRAAGWIALFVVVALVCSAGGVVYHYYSEYKSRHSSYAGDGFGSVDVTVPVGATADSIGPELQRLGVIAAVDPWASYVANKPDSLHPGEFKLHQHMSPAAAWTMLNNPASTVNSTVTIPDGYRYSVILPRLAKESGIPISQFQTAIKDTAALGLPSWANGNPEGFLYPDTYDIVPGSTTALQILQMAVHQFNSVMTSINLPAEAHKADFTENQIITEASLLEAEVGPNYYEKVARTLDNRIAIGMPLQLDSTISYITRDYSFNLSNAQLHTPSPYNTFLHADLPPGPIDQPDLAAIDAVLHPAPTSDDWTYFITVNKAGLTDFTNSQSQFLAWQSLAAKNGV